MRGKDATRNSGLCIHMANATPARVERESWRGTVEWFAAFALALALYCILAFFGVLPWFR